jgi:hypothetical protein
VASGIALGKRQFDAIYENVPDGTTMVEIHRGPAVAEGGSVTVEYFQGSRRSVTFDFDRDGTIHELDDDG